MRTSFITKRISIFLIMILPFILNAADIQQGLICDKSFRPLQRLDKPCYLKTVVDPAFGVTIRRITDAGNSKVPVRRYCSRFHFNNKKWIQYWK